MKAAEMLGSAREQKLTGPAEDNVLIDILTKAEAGKQALNADKDADRDYVEAFAHSVFDKCDVADRSGNATKATASQYYVAGTFYEVCSQFYGGELPPDLGEKKKYANWRAVEILRCLKAGTAITPPPEAQPSNPSPEPGTQETGALAPEPPPTPTPQPSAAPTQGFVPFVPPASQPSPAPTQGFTPFVPPVQAPAIHQQPAPALVPSVQPIPGRGPAPAQIKQDAKKKVEFASSCLEWDDMAGAQKFLNEALQLLGSYED